MFPKELSSMHIVEGKHDFLEKTVIGRVPVVAANGSPLMPCKPSKARKILKENKATKQWSKLGIFYLQLKYNPEKPLSQPLVLGVDCGSKFEGYSIVGTKDTVLNIMSEATTWVSKAVEQRRIMRRARRYRKTRRRQCRFNNRLSKRIPPSTRARWNTKLRIIQQLEKILPINIIVVEDIKAVTRKTCKSQSRWNTAFSPLEVGKQHFYSQINRQLVLRSGMETKVLREVYGLRKLKNKSKQVFETHCVDAWVLAASMAGPNHPSTKSLYYLVPLRRHRRQLHRLQPERGGKRKLYGGTLSLGLKRGSLVKHRKHGFCYVGGCLNGNVSLHSVTDGKRLTQTAKKQECKVLTRLEFRTQFLPCLKSMGILGGS
jgi:hypothetical protein